MDLKLNEDCARAKTTRLAERAQLKERRRQYAEKQRLKRKALKRDARHTFNC